MKKCLSLFLSLLLIAALAACGSSELSFEPGDAAAAVMKDGSFSDLLSPVDERVAKSLYGVSDAEVVSCCVYCSTGATAEEIAVFRCADENAAKTVEAAARARLDSQKAAYATYAPDAVPAIENALVRTRGGYVACVVSGDSAVAGQILDGYMK